MSFFESLLSSQLEHEFERDFFRPPGTEDEMDFLTLCSRCGLCRDNCPERIVKLFTASAGAKLVRTPYINPNAKPCTFCNKCIEVCPTDALSLKNATQVGIANINEKTCLAYQNVLCDYCVQSCPFKGAIQLKEGKPVVNKETCNGCGLCVAKCISEVKGVHISLPST